MAKEYYITEVTTWSVKSKSQSDVQNTLGKFKHMKVMDSSLKDFIEMVDSIVDDANHEHSNCKGMTFTCSKLYDGLLLFHVRAGAKDVAVMKLYPILSTWKEDTK